MSDGDDGDEELIANEPADIPPDDEDDGDDEDDDEDNNGFDDDREEGDNDSPTGNDEQDIQVETVSETQSTHFDNHT